MNTFKLSLLGCLLGATSPLLQAATAGQSMVNPQSGVVVGYWHNWCDGAGYKGGVAPCVSLEQVNPQYNVVAVSFMKVHGSNPIPTFKLDPAIGLSESQFITQIAELNAQGRSVLLALGGADAHIELRSVTEVPLETVLHQQSRHGQAMVASSVSDGAGWVMTDFHLHDGFSHFLLLDNGFTPRQAGRIAQRLVEIETYRVMALLAFPVAKDVGRLVSRAEDELADLMDGMGQSRSAEDDRAVLVRLSRLAAEVERSVARTTFRFGAAGAYYRLVRQRIDDLREQRLPGFSPIGEFMDRRLVPAIDTCTSIARRQDDLSGRVARNSQLLRTRVDVEIERQNQELLAQMNRRAKIQLHLQETVEGLSVVAITYYASQLVNYVAKGAKDYIAPATPEVLNALSIPVIAGLVYMGLRRMRKLLGKEEGETHA